MPSIRYGSVVDGHVVRKPVEEKELPLENVEEKKEEEELDVHQDNTTKVHTP